MKASLTEITEKTPALKHKQEAAEAAVKAQEDRVSTIRGVRKEEGTVYERSTVLVLSAGRPHV